MTTDVRSLTWLRKLGSGSQGEVWAAREHPLGRDVVVKVLRAELTDNDVALARFENEARALSQVRHNHVVGLLYTGRTHAGVPFMVLDPLKGETLRSRLRRGAIPWREASRLAHQVAQGIGALHSAGIIHRDLKPENVFLEQHGSGSCLCKVLDLGSVKSSHSPDLTREGALIGTLRYMAPEQVNQSKISPFVDIHAWGALLFEMITGRPAFTGDSEQLIVFHLLNTTAPRLQQLAPDVPESLDRLVAQALSKVPEDRPTLQAASSALSNLLAQADPMRLLPSDLQDGHPEATTEPDVGADEAVASNSRYMPHQASRLALLSALVAGGVMHWTLAGWVVPSLFTAEPHGGLDSRSAQASPEVMLGASLDVDVGPQLSPTTAEVSATAMPAATVSPVDVSPVDVGVSRPAPRSGSQTNTDELGKAHPVHNSNSSAVEATELQLPMQSAQSPAMPTGEGTSRIAAPQPPESTRGPKRLVVKNPYQTKAR